VASVIMAVVVGGLCLHSFRSGFWQGGCMFLIVEAFLLWPIVLDLIPRTAPSAARGS
jgi:hypothetical protein